MESHISGDIINLVVFLLPGFVCAWVFYGLTSHLKPSQFERTIQALIYTFVIRSIVICIEFIFIKIGSIFLIIGQWSKSTEMLISLVVSLCLGVIFAYLVNADMLYRYLRKFKLTTRTSHPSEWFYVFSEKITFVILHMRDGRRLYGWPKEWPLEPNKGQFYILLPAWILENGEQVDLPELDGVLIRAEDVKWVEFLKPSEES